MKAFIELTDAYDNQPILVNLDHIEYIKQPAQDEEDKRNNAFPFVEVVLNGKLLCVDESYEDVLKMLMKGAKL